MELTHEFSVGVPVERAWAVLTDLERIAPCMPGAELTEVDGDTYHGLVKVKVGPITAQFKGQASFVERDAEQHRAVLKAEGRDTGGKGNASALITAQLEEVDAEMTKVTVSTDLTITGKVAQFGRGALADVSEKLLRQFVTNLETTVLTNGDAAAAAAPAATAPAEAGPIPAEAPAQPVARKVESAPVEPIDLLETAGPPMLKRLAPLLGGIVVLLVVWRLVRRRR